MRFKQGAQPQATRYSSSVYRVTADERDRQKLPVELQRATTQIVVRQDSEGKTVVCASQRNKCTV